MKLNKKFWHAIYFVLPTNSKADELCTYWSYVWYLLTLTLITCFPFTDLETLDLSSIYWPWNWWPLTFLLTLALMTFDQLTNFDIDDLWPIYWPWHIWPFSHLLTSSQLPLFHLLTLTLITFSPVLAMTKKIGFKYTSHWHKSISFCCLLTLTQFTCFPRVLRWTHTFVDIGHCHTGTTI